MALFAIMVATAGPNMRRSSVSTKGAALTLAAALSETRQQAITQQVPVALVIPSGNGTQGQADSYYIAAGEQPRVTQVKRLGGEQSNLRLMVGHWPLDTSKLTTPTSTTTITPPPEATWENDFNLNQWALPAPEDYAFVFTPRGKLLTNDLPHFDGAYHLVISDGGRSTMAAAPGTGVMATQPTMHSLTQVGTPYTVTIDPAGSVSVSPGLVAMAVGGVAVEDQAATDPPPDPPALASPPGSPPVVRSVTLMPDPAKLTLPSGVNMLLAPDRHMTITTRARSPHRVPLFCQWDATGGGLSSPQEVRTTYLPLTQEWESVWQWRFPADAEPGDQFTLQGVIKDAFGNEAPLGLGSKSAPFVVEAGRKERAVFVSGRTGDWEIFMTGLDGTRVTRLTESTGLDHNATWSPDGQRIVFTSARSDPAEEIYTMNADGTGLTRLTNVVGHFDWYPTYSPAGNRIAFFSTRNNHDMDFFVMNADGTGLVNLSKSSLQDTGRPELYPWSPDGTRLLFVRLFSANEASIFLAPADGSGVTRMTNCGKADGYPAWSPDGSQIAFSSNRDGNYEIYVMNADGSGQTRLTNAAGDDLLPRWSPDGTRIAFDSKRDGNDEVYVMNADGTGQTNLTNHASSDKGGVWLSDGSKIAFDSRRSGRDNLWIMNSDGTGMVNFTKGPGTDSIFARTPIR